MAGTIFSGWYGRRSGRPYFDELPRLAAGERKHLAPGLLTATAGTEKLHRAAGASFFWLHDSTAPGLCILPPCLPSAISAPCGLLLPLRWC